MKIGVDVRALYLPNMKGIGIYLKNLLSAISEIDSGSEFHLYYDGRQQVVKRKPAPERFIEKELIIPKGDTFYFWEQFKLPSQLRKEKLDVFHSPANTTFLMKSCPVVVTVHDTTVQEIAHGSFVKELYFKKVQPFLLRKAEKIIAPSNSSKNNIVNILKVDPEKVVVIYQGLNQRFRVINDPEAVEGTKTKLGIAGPYILFTGGESVWKNISRLIEAYAMLKRRNKISEKLIVTGIRSQEILAKHMREIERLKITSDVSVLGYLNEDDLVSLYNGARVFVYPSL
ncbi:MAG: glycosyltransferase, partial [Candidatus Omnitrophota bacterium]